MKIKDRIIKLLEALNHDVFEKEEVVKLTFISAIIGESIFLLGPPGVAKSLIARRLKFAFEGGKSFEYLMNRFSTPDEIFGPVSIQKLKDEDKFERNTDMYLPGANIVFLDEIWKAGPSIQNSLLTILNEKIYRNGEQEIACDIRGLISASNELPEKEKGLEALWDRFLIRYVVNGIEDRGNFNKMISEKLTCYDDNIPKSIKIKNTEYKTWNKKIDDVEIPEEVFNVIHFIRAKIQDLSVEAENKVYISDRRWRKIIRFLRGSAFLNGRKKVDLMDCFLIAFCIWDKPEQLEEMKNLIASTIKEHGYALNLSLKNIDIQIEKFEKEEVKTGTESILEYEEDEYHQPVKGYYEIIGLKRHAQFNKIKIEDYKKINTSQISIDFFSDVNNGTKRAMNAYYQGENLVINSGQWDTCSLKRQKVVKTKTIFKTPTTMLKDAWDKHVLELYKIIDGQIKKVEDYKNGNLAQLRTNIFVDSELAPLVESNLSDTIDELNQMRINVEKIKNYYDNTKSE